MLSTEERLLSAFERIKSGKPENPKLKLPGQSGKTKINCTNVALEAGVSRTLIGHDGCAYPEVRMKILAAQGRQESRSKQVAEVGELKRQMSDLRALLQKKDVLLAAQHLEIQKLTAESGDAGDGKVVSFRGRRQSSRASAKTR